MDDCPRQDPAYRQLRKGPAPAGPFYMSVPGWTSTPGFATSEVEKPGADALPRRGVPRKQGLTRPWIWGTSASAVRPTTFRRHGAETAARRTCMAVRRPATRLLRRGEGERRHPNCGGFVHHRDA